MNLDEKNYKNFKVKNHNEFILKLKEFRKNHRLIDNDAQWLNNNLSPYLLNYVKNEELINISIWKIGKGCGSYFIFKWRLI